MNDSSFLTLHQYKRRLISQERLTPIVVVNRILKNVYELENDERWIGLNYCHLYPLALAITSFLNPESLTLMDHTSHMTPNNRK